MLRRSVPQRVFGALLGSPLVADVLFRHLAALRWPTRPRDPAPRFDVDTLKRDLQTAIQHDLDRRTGSRIRPNEVEAAARMLQGEGFLTGPDWPALDTMFNDVLARQGMYVAIRDKQVPHYAALLAEIDPTVLVAWQFTPELAGANGHALAGWKAALESLPTLFVGPRFFEQPFAENHAHLGGITGDDFVLAQLLFHWLPPAKAKPEQKGHPLFGHADYAELEPDRSIRLRRIHRLIAGFVALWKAGDNLDEPALAEHEKALARACPEDAGTLLTSTAMHWAAQDEGLVVDPAVGGSRWLLKQLAGAASQRDLQHAWMWLFVLLWHTYRSATTTTIVRAATLLLVADIMALRRELIVNGYGLRRFTTTYFLPPLRSAAGRDDAWKRASHKETARRLFARSGDRAEVKLGVNRFKKADFTRAFAQVVEERVASLIAVHEHDEAALQADSGLDHWHFCLHLNRTASDSRHERRKELWQEARELKWTLGSQVKWDLAPLAHGDASTRQFLPMHFVRGLDVAGDETAWPIAVFAPMLRWLRHREWVDQPMEGAMVPAVPMHFSIHAGEDYGHPLSGLRHVDETVRFCGMGQGDRLGHALALGIAPEAWFRRHGNATLSVNEHVDNLVWAWHQAVELEGRLDVARRVRPRLEQRIERFLPHVSWRPSMPGPVHAPFELLHEAWLLRRNCSYLVLEQPQDLPLGDSALEVGVPDLETIRGEVEQPAFDTAAGLYVHWARSERSLLASGATADLVVCLTALKGSRVPRAQAENETDEPNALGQMHDHDNALDLEFMMALQDACIERYAKDGLSIETNPSSNVYIGQIETHDDHPIYRWDPPDPADLNEGGAHNQFNLRTTAMPVTINTDDQGIVPTTLRLEHHFMHEAALEHAPDEGRADVWIEELRNRGMNHFDRTHGMLKE